MRKLGDAKRANSMNSCVASAISALTGIEPDELVREFRTIAPKACTRREGTGKTTYVPVLSRYGWDARYYRADGKPMHEVLRDLHRTHPDKPLLVIVREPRGSTHAIAGLGFMLVDNTTVHPMWYADWIAAWREARTRSRWAYVPGTATGWEKRTSVPRPTLVDGVYVLERRF